MHSVIRAGLIAGIVVLPCLGQDVLGILNNTDTSFTSRGSTALPNTNPSTAYLRIDADHYAGWGVNPATPGMREIVGLYAVLQDQIGTTPETFDILVYGEDPAAANYPLAITPLATAGPFPTPASTATGAVAWVLTANFTTPVLAPAGQDVFVAVGLPQPATGTWPTDGMSCHALYFVNVTSGFFDLPGFAHPTSPPEQAGNGGWYVPSLPSGPLYTVTPRMWKIQPLVNGATGVAGTITNQTTATQSNLPPGTASMASGLHPDAQNPPLNAGRADDISGRWFKTGTPDGTPVFFLMDFGTFGPELPVSVFLPGSTGVACLNLGTMTTLGINFTVGGQAFQVLTIPANSRGILAGISVLHQAAGFDPVSGTAMVNGCTRQVL